MTESEGKYCDLLDEHLLLAYSEGMLGPQERLSVEQHLARCGRCAAEARDLQELIRALKEQRGSFCPEPWQVFEFVHYGRDPGKRISLHLESCPADRAMATLFEAQGEAMPDALWDKIRPIVKLGRKIGWFADLVEWYRRPWDLPAFGMATVAAAMLLVVFVAHQETYLPVVSLSSVKYDVATPKPADFSRDVVAVLLTFEGFPEARRQEEIDDLYKMIAPGMDLYEDDSVLAPFDVAEARDRQEISLVSREALIEGLNERLGVTIGVFVTFRPLDHGVTARVEVLDCRSGSVVATSQETGKSFRETAAKVAASFNLLLQTRTAIIEGLNEKLGVSGRVFVTLSPGNHDVTANVEVLDGPSGSVSATETGTSPDEIATKVTNSLKPLLPERSKNSPQGPGRDLSLPL